MLDRRKLEENLKKIKSEKCRIEVKPFQKNIPAEDFVAKDPDHPDAKRYDIIYIVDEKTGFIALVQDYFYEIDMQDAIIKEIKKRDGIKDPWDDDPEYMKKKYEQAKVAYEERVLQSLKDKNGNYYLLKINPACEDQTSEEFIPEYLDYPNACRYFIYEYDDNGKEKVVYLKEDPFRYKNRFKEDVVKQLKKIHNIHDPWDDKDLSDEWDAKRMEVYNSIREKRDKGELPSKMKLGKNQVGQRKEEVYLISEREDEIYELWRGLSSFMDMKIITWVEKVDEENNKDILQDRQVILEREEGKGDKAWRLVYQKWNRTYTLDENGEKQWIGANHNSILKYEEYYYDDDIKVKFYKKR